MAASPTCRNCFPQSALAAFCVSGSRSKGCGSTVRMTARARVKIERARRWERRRRRGEMGAIFIYIKGRGRFLLVEERLCKVEQSRFLWGGVEWFLRIQEERRVVDIERTVFVG